MCVDTTVYLHYDESYSQWNGFGFTKKERILLITYIVSMAEGIRPCVQHLINSGSSPARFGYVKIIMYLLLWKSLWNCYYESSFTPTDAYIALIVLNKHLTQIRSSYQIHVWLDSWRFNIISEEVIVLETCHHITYIGNNMERENWTSSFHSFLE